MGLLDNEQRIYQNLLDFGRGDPNFIYGNYAPIRYPVNAPKAQSFAEFRKNAELATPNFLRSLPAQLFKSFTLPAQAVRGKMITPQEATDFALTYGGTALTGASLGGVPKGAIGMAVGKSPKKSDTIKLYHGSSSGIDFDSPRETLYLTDNLEYAKNYLNPNFSAFAKSGKRPESNPQMYKIEIENKDVFDTRKPEHKKIFDEYLQSNSSNRTPLTEKGLPDWTDGEDLAEFLQNKKFNFKSAILDEGGFFDFDGNVVDRGVSYVLFNKKNVKKIK